MLLMPTDMRDFDKWLDSFRPSIADYTYYVDFKKVFNNVENIKIPLNILNSLIGSKNIEDEFRAILTQYPETLKCIPILLAKRELDIMAMDEEGQIDFHFDKPNCTNDEYIKFMRKTETGISHVGMRKTICLIKLGLKLVETS